jgi:Na+/H+ antiporter NhaD/arsenite permease-like protein
MNLLNYPSLIVLIGVLFLIAVRQVGRFKFQIWQAMLLGAVAVLVLGEIRPVEALKAINLDVMLFLFGMFVVGEALHQSGYLYQMSHRVFRRSRSVDHLILLIMFVIGILSALLMNDTLAIICTPLVLYFARQHKVSPKLLLLALAFAVTTGSVLSPIGNPQNLLIAVNGKVSNPFVTYFRYLAVPTLVNMFLAYLALKIYHPNHFQNGGLNHEAEKPVDAPLAGLAKVSLVLIGIMVAGKIILVTLGTGIDFSLTYIALIAAAPILIFSRRRLKVLAKIDWFTLVFFAAMFVLMDSVWKSGFFQGVIAGADVDLKSTPAILGVSSIMTQLVSNVPFVALYLPLLKHIGDSTAGIMALAAGATISGNLTIMGAASNVIIIQNAEKEGQTLTFMEFLRVGFPLTFVQVMVYWAWFTLTS